MNSSWHFVRGIESTHVRKAKRVRVLEGQSARIDLVNRSNRGISRGKRKSSD